MINLNSISRIYRAFHPSARYIGHVDELTVERARGWAIDLRSAKRPARIGVAVDDSVIAMGNASGPRSDVSSLGFPSSICGFDIPLDLLPRDIASGRVAVGFLDKGRFVHSIKMENLSLGHAALDAKRPWGSRHTEAEGVGAPDEGWVDWRRGAEKHRYSILVEGVLAGDYSLAIVNRHFARALIKSRQNVRVHSAESSLNGDILFNADLQVKERFVSDPNSSEYEIHTLNNWPPDTSHMKSGFNVLHCYAWEESEFPPHYVRQFNTHLNLICVSSRYTKEALENSGVVVPIEIIGNGVDPMLAKGLKARKATGAKPFTFLHVSSCFPRKGADVLARAFFEEFGPTDDARLVIKTFDNPHNEIEAQLTKLGRGSIPPSVQVIKRNLSPSELYDLYLEADCLVAPSRGEGFLLPAAEAMAIHLPVIVTDAGGQSDFCDLSTSWLVRSGVTAAATHMALRNSFWFEPDVESLKQQMRAVYAATPEAIAAKTERARRRIADLYTWDKVAGRFLNAIDKHRQNVIASPERRRVAIVSTWNQDCGIATYTGNLAASIPEDFEVTIVGEDLGRIVEDESFVSRVWMRSRAGIRLLCDYLIRSKFDAVLVQHHPGIIGWEDLGFLVEALSESREPRPAVFIQFHSTAGSRDALRRVAASLAKASALFVHTLADVLELPGLAQSTRVAVIPHGISTFPRIANSREDDSARDTRNRASERVFRVGSFGFCMPHKGILEHLRALHMLRGKIPNLEATLLHAITGDKKTITYALQTARLTKTLELDAVVDLDFRLLPMEEVRRRLSTCDVLVFPYRPNSESASGALREVAGLDIPLLCTPVSTFDDIVETCFLTDGFEAIDIADAIYSLYADRDKALSKKRVQSAYVEAHSWDAARERLFNIIRAELRDGDARSAKR